MEEDDAVPEAFVCPITQEQMVDPVVAMDGHSYSRAAIQDWFRQGRLSSPCTNERLSSDQLVPNHSLRKAMEQRRAQQLQQQEQQRIAPNLSLKTVVLTVLVMLVGISLLLHCRHEDGDKSRCRDCYRSILRGIVMRMRAHTLTRADCAHKHKHTGVAGFHGRGVCGLSC
jgi:hypothetical protein